MGEKTNKQQDHTLFSIQIQHSVIRYHLVEEQQLLYETFRTSTKEGIEEAQGIKRPGYLFF